MRRITLKMLELAKELKLTIFSALKIVIFSSQKIFIFSMLRMIMLLLVAPLEHAQADCVR